MQSYIIGRAGDIALYDDTVSRRHACLEIDGESLFLKDLDSRNGTYEIRDRELIPFTHGAVTLEQVFAFGECVRSVRQLLAATDGADDVLDETIAAMGNDDEDDPLEATKVGIAPHADAPPPRRLSPADIIRMLETAEDALAEGKEVGDICIDLGITQQRYERWCREYGATRTERENSTVMLRRENERLRALVADLSLEREALREKIRELEARPPSLSVVADAGK